jgi:MFS family permease
MDAITYLFVIGIFSFIKYTPIVKDEIHKSNLWNRLKMGTSYLNENRIVFVFGLVSYMLFAFTLVELHIVLPSYVHDFLSAKGNIYASSEIYYSLGAIFSGVLILRILKNVNPFLSVIFLMIIVAAAFLSMTFYKFLWVFFLGNLILGITNAGVRIVRTTYLFNNVPNNLIGRVTSVFSSLNIIVRMFLIALFSLNFFTLSDNIRWAYLIGTLLMLMSSTVLYLTYMKKVKD